MKNNIIVLLLSIPSLIVIILWSLGYVIYSPLNNPLITIFLPIGILLFIGFKKNFKFDKLLIISFIFLMGLVSLLYVDQRLGAALKPYESQDLEVRYDEEGQIEYRRYYCEKPELWSQSRAGFGLFNRETDLYKATQLPLIKTRNGVTEYLEEQEICIESN